MHAFVLRQPDQMRGDRFPRQLALDVPGPSHNFDAEFRAFLQSVNQPLRTITCAQYVHPLAEIMLLRQPGIRTAPTQQSKGQNDEADQCGFMREKLVARQKAMVDEPRRTEKVPPARAP